MRPVFAAAALVLGWLSPAQAQQPPQPFELPVECDMESVCSVQLYPDLDPSEGGFTDYACGRLSYDGSTGTDIRVRNLADMERGVPVVAAAPGVVLEIRDGMEDVNVTETGVDALEGRFAGNAVGIDHGNGWFAQYSHLKKGSVRVKAGDRVETGTPLGLIGLSGRTNYPHVEFVVYHEGKLIDPFVGPIEEFFCSVPRRPLWSEAALAAMAYRPAWLLNAGFADQAVTTDGVRRGDYTVTELPTVAPVISFWANYANALGSDRFELTVTGPDGTVVLRNMGRVEKAQYTFYAFAGRRMPDAGWMPGIYRGSFGLFRGGRRILFAERELTVR